MAKQIPDEIHAATSLEVSRLIAAFTAKHRAATEELVALQKARKEGAPIDAPLPPNVAEARTLAAKMLNGNAPAFFEAETRTQSREQQLELERQAIDIAIGALQKDSVKIRAAEAVAWRQEHIREWQTLARDVLLTAMRLEQLEAKARAFRRSAPKSIALPLAPYIGNENDSIYDTSGLWGSDFLSRPRIEALALGIISERDIAAVGKD